MTAASVSATTSAMVRRLWLVALTVGALGGCNAPAVKGDRDAAQPPDPITDFSAAPGYDPDWSAARSARTGPRPPATRLSPSRTPHVDDPLRGRWTVQQATATLPAGQQLVATITTSAGELSCQLWPDRAPQAVALFIGLANGLRPWKTKHGWLRKPAFDGSPLAPVKPGGLRLGPPAAAARGDLGLTIAVEPWPGMRLDRPGLLCLRTGQGPAAELTVLITTGPSSKLPAQPDAGSGAATVTALGECGPAKLVAALSKPSVGSPSSGRVKQARVTRK